MSLVTQAQELDRQARDTVKEIQTIEIQGGKKIVRLANILAKMYALYEKKKPGDEPVEGFASFVSWMREVTKPLSGKGENRGYIYLSVGRQLLGRLPDDLIEELGIEKCRSLARYQKQKHELPEALVEAAKVTPHKEFRENVAIELSGGNPMHEGGPKGCMELVAPRESLKTIHNLIEECRPGSGEGKWVPDHEVIEEALVELKAKYDESESRRQAEISGVPVVTKDDALMWARWRLNDLKMNASDDAIIKMIECALNLPVEEIDKRTSKLIESKAREYQEANDGIREVV